MSNLLSRVRRAATRHRNGALDEVPLDDIATNDLLLIRHGDVASVDGTVESERPMLDRSALRGGSMPARLAHGQDAMSGSTSASEAFDLRGHAAACRQHHAEPVNFPRTAALMLIHGISPNPTVDMSRSSIIAIGASAGGVAALRTLAAALPGTLSAPVLVVLHIGAFRSELPALLNAAGPVPAKHAEDGETVLPGHIYVAPPDRHMIVADGRLRLLRGPKENCARPAIDPLFRSVAESYGPDAVGVILTGNLNDGALGLFEIKRLGGVAIGQDPDDADYPEMPRSAAEHVALDYSLALADMPQLLIDLIERKDGKEVVMPKTPSQLNGQEPEIIDSQTFERPLTVTCPDCGGALKKFKVGSMVKFGCHIGHTYTAEIMATAQFEEMEKVMRAAVRFLNERAEFCLQMAEQSWDAHPDASDEWHAASKQALDRAYKLRDLVEQEWLTPETSRQPSVANDGPDQTRFLG